jgi:hypothetical protein
MRNGWGPAPRAISMGSSKSLHVSNIRDSVNNRFIHRLRECEQEENRAIIVR